MIAGRCCAFRFPGGHRPPLQSALTSRRKPMSSSQFQQWRRRRLTRWLIVSAITVIAVRVPQSFAQSVTRAEALKIGESFIEHRWQAFAKNLKHGKDSAG